MGRLQLYEKPIYRQCAAIARGEALKLGLTDAAIWLAAEEQSARHAALVPAGTEEARPAGPGEGNRRRRKTRLTLLNTSARSLLDQALREDGVAVSEGEKEAFADRVGYLMYEPILLRELRAQLRARMEHSPELSGAERYDALCAEMEKAGLALCAELGIGHVPEGRLNRQIRAMAEALFLEAVDQEVLKRMSAYALQRTERDDRQFYLQTAHTYFSVAAEAGAVVTHREIQRRAKRISANFSGTSFTEMEADESFAAYASSVKWADIEALFPNRRLSDRFRRELEAWIDDIEQTMTEYDEAEFERKLLEVVGQYATAEEQEALRRTYVGNTTYKQEFVRRMIEMSKVIRIGAMLESDRSLQHITERVIELSRIQRFRTSHRDMRRLIRRIYDNLNGYDILQPLIDDKEVTEIMVNGYRNIYIERGGQLYRYPLEFTTPRMLELRVIAIANRLGRQINERSPIVDSRLEDGSRVNIIVPPVALNGHTLTIRKFPEKTYELIPDLVNRFRALPRHVAELLGDLVKAKYNIFIGGGTGSGKTTFLNALSQYIPGDERVITIEDAAELQILSVQNLVRLETRPSRSADQEPVEIRDLIRSALRMRPNRIIVGEVRGREALDMLQAMNTGHDGSLSTGHANSTRDMISRIEMMVLSGGVELPIAVIRKQIVSAVDIFVHLARLRDRSRKVVEIYEVDGIDEQGEVRLNPLFRFVEKPRQDDDPRKVTGDWECVGKLMHRDKWLQAGFSEQALEQYFRQEER